MLLSYRLHLTNHEICSNLYTKFQVCTAFANSVRILNLQVILPELYVYLLGTWIWPKLLLLRMLNGQRSQGIVGFQLTFHIRDTPIPMPGIGIGLIGAKKRCIGIGGGISSISSSIGS